MLDRLQVCAKVRPARRGDANSKDAAVLQESALMRLHLLKTARDPDAEVQEWKLPNSL